MARMLGKKPAIDDPRTLKLSRYAAPVREAPESCDWHTRVSAHPVFMNDRLGCCAIATVAHQRRAWTANDSPGGAAQVTDEQVLAGYARIGGYRPGNPRTDNGCVMLDVMRTWRRESVCGAKIGAFAKIDATDRQLMKFAVHAFGGALLGVQLPAAVEQTEDWRAPTNPAEQVGPWGRGSWGGHAVPAVGYDREWLYFVSWGKLFKMSWHFFECYNDEAYVAVSADWLGPDFRSPAGIDLAVLLHDAQEIRNVA